MSDRDCKHGQLARSCEICDLEAENERLRNERAVLLALLRDWCKTPWLYSTYQMLVRTRPVLEDMR